MRKNYIFLAVFGCIGGFGCGSEPKELPVAKPAHAGQLVSLPNDRGFAEIVVEVPSTVKRGSREKVKSQLVAYFYQPDGKTELTPGPTGVAVRIGSDENGRMVELTAQKSEAGKYASEPGEYPDGFKGSLDANFNSETVHVPLMLR